MQDSYRDPLRLARTVNIFLALYFVADVMFSASALYTIVAIDKFLAGSADSSELEASDTLGAVTGLFLAAVLIVVAILLCRWIIRVNRNAQVFDSQGVMTVSPKWNVGYFFVPFANLVMPFRGLAQTFQVSADPQAPQTVAVPVMMRLWWGSWLVAGILGNISLRLSMRAETLEELRLSSLIDMISLLPDMLAVGALAWLVRTLTEKQHSNLATLAALPVDPAPAD